MIAFCENKKPHLAPESVADKFRDYWISQPGQKGVKLDWSATWRNWVRNEKQQYCGNETSGADEWLKDQGVQHAAIG